MQIEYYFDKEIKYAEINSTITKNKYYNDWNFYVGVIKGKKATIGIQSLDYTNKQKLEELEKNKEELYLSIVPHTEIRNGKIKNGNRFFLNTQNGDKIPIKHFSSNYDILNMVLFSQEKPLVKCYNYDN